MHDDTTLSYPRPYFHVVQATPSRSSDKPPTEPTIVHVHTLAISSHIVSLLLTRTPRGHQAGMSSRFQQVMHADSPDLTHYQLSLPRKAQLMTD